MGSKAASGSMPITAARLSKSVRTLRARADKTLQRRNPEDLSGVGPSPWPELPLQEIYGKAKACRLRQHINPLRAEYQIPRKAPDWHTVFEDCTLPLILDIGCAGGRFILAMAHKYSNHNFLGLDIRSPLIVRANEWAQELSLGRRAFFDQANATVSLQSMLNSYPGPLQLATVQFPDPHFKQRHKKRRIVQPQLIADLSKIMPPKGRVFLQSDVQEVTAEMRDEFEIYGFKDFRLAPEHTLVQGHMPDSEGGQSTVGDHALSAGGGSVAECRQAVWGSSSREALASKLRSKESSGAGVDCSLLQWAAAGYLLENPLGVPTEREVQTLKQGDPVFRVLLERQ